MAKNAGEVISLKVWFDKQRERVIFAESDSHFVDILFSFLTLPMGTMVKLLLKDQPQCLLGCIKTLYEGIENLDLQHFRLQWCKYVLVHLKNPSQAQCRRLKLNIDDTKPTKYFLCEDCYTLPSALLKISPGQKCRCGKVMKKEMLLTDDFNGYRASDSKEGVFVKETAATFILTDDLQVIPSSTASTLEIFAKAGVKDVHNLKEKTLNFGLPEVVSLLRLCLVSKTPLTDMIMLKHLETSSMLVLDRDIHIQSRKASDILNGFKKMKLKVMLRKSNKRVLFVEAKEDFVNFLLILPTITLGSMVKFLDNSPSLGCICNLSKSVKDLSVDGYIKSDEIKAKLLSPKLGLQFGHRGTKHQMTNMLNDDVKTIHADPTSLIAMNSACTIERIGAEKLVKEPAMYMVTDDLTVTPILSIIPVLSHLQIPLSELDVREVSFGKKEARRLLEASLVSNSALTVALNFNVSRKKCF